VATNNGPNDVEGAVVSDLFPAQLTNITWTCVASAGASCSPSGADTLHDVVDLPVGASVAYTVHATVGGGASGSVHNTATIRASHFNDFAPANNSATDVDIIPIIFEANFNAGVDGFAYADDMFRGTAQPNYANGTYQAAGGFSGGGLHVIVGGNNSNTIQNMSGGWQRSFTLSNPTPVSLTFRYNLLQTDELENDEFVQMLVSLDGVLYGAPPNDYVNQVVGGGPLTTGWQEFEIDFGTVPAGTHVLAFGGFMNQKTRYNEWGDVFIDDVLLAGGTAADTAPVIPPSIVSHPANVMVTEPAAAAFTVVSAGTPPLSYQWRRNGVDIPGATSSTFVFDPTAVINNGDLFDVVVTNAAGSATSASATLTVNATPVPPSITIEPAPVAVIAPAAAAFSVVAAGDAPLTYQWRRNAVAIVGATASTYVLNPTAGIDNGALFDVVVTNGAGNATSLPALLTVNVAPAVVTPPNHVTVFEPNQAAFSVVASGDAPLAYQWRRDGIDIPGANADTYVLNPTSLADNGAHFDVVVTNAFGAATSAAANLTVLSTGGEEGSNVLFSAHFDIDADDFTYADDLFRGTSQPSYASGNHMPAGGFSGGALRVMVGGVNGSTIVNMSGGWRRSFTLASPSPVALSFRYNLTETAEYETDEFSQMLFSLDGVLYGFPPNDYIAQVVGGGPTTTGWQQVEINFGTLAAGTHTLAFGAFNNQKSRANESAEVLLDDVLLTGGTAPSAATIVTDPSDVTVNAPAAAAFSVVAAGDAPLSYQWRRDGIDIPGATNDTYVLDPTDPSDDGAEFDVVVSNAGGSVTSAAATLTVNVVVAPPSVTTHPDHVTVIEPENATFSVVATGDAPLTYQWRRNSVDIPGANADTYEFGPTVLANSGDTFDVVVTNAHGSATSDAAILTVLEAGTSTILVSANFDGGVDGFTYLDDAFRGTAQPAYAQGAHLPAGGFSGGGLQVIVGGKSGTIVHMSGGWQANFTLASPAAVTLSFRYRLTEEPTYETDEFNQMLVSVDGILYGTAPNDYIAQVVGGGPTSTGWQQVEINLGTLAAGNHVLRLGGYNNQKTRYDEFMEVLIDDVLVTH
jgi:hypothetical protein